MILARTDGWTKVRDRAILVGVCVRVCVSASVCLYLILVCVCVKIRSIGEIPQGMAVCTDDSEVRVCALLPSPPRTGDDVLDSKGGSCCSLPAPESISFSPELLVL